MLIIVKLVRGRGKRVNVILTPLPLRERGLFRAEGAEEFETSTKRDIFTVGLRFAISVLQRLTQPSLTQNCQTALRGPRRLPTHCRICFGRSAPESPAPCRSGP
jgi:hypothetical protein